MYYTSSIQITGIIIFTVRQLHIYHKIKKQHIWATLAGETAAQCQHPVWVHMPIPAALLPV